MTKIYENKEMRIPKYASLLSDAGFKAVLASPRNKNVLKRLLNLVLPEDRRIIEIESYEDREINGFTPFSKYARVDIRCRDIEGRSFIVEMQREMHKTFFERCIWYASKSYEREVMPGEEYGSLKPVFIVAFLEERFEHENESLWNSEHCVSCYQMIEKRTGEFAPDTIMCIFVELGRFLKDGNELSDSFDKACFVFKNSEKWDNDAPAEVMDDALASELTQACEVANFPPDVKLNYVRDMFTEMDYHAEMNEAYRRGDIHGFANGRAEGIAETAVNLLAAGIPIATISSCTGLSAEEINKIASERNG